MLSLPLSRRRGRNSACAQTAVRPGVKRPAAATAGGSFARDAFFADPARVESDYVRLARRRSEPR